MNIRPTLLGGLAAAAVALAGASAASADTIRLRVASYTPAGNFTNELILAPFLDRVVADSEGTLEYQLFPGGTLGRNPVEQARLVQDGVADIAYVLPVFTPGELDPYAVIEIPGLIHSPLEGSIALAEAYSAGLLPTPAGTRLLGLFSSDVNILSTATEIDSLAGLQGLRIRTAGRPQANAVELLGGVPTSGLTSSETAEAVARGTVDGVVMGPGALVAFRVNETVTTHIQLPMGAPAFLVLMNENTWQSLSKAARAAFVKHGGERFAHIAGQTFSEQEANFLSATLALEGHRELPVDDAMLADFTELTARLNEEFAARGPGFGAVLESVQGTLERLRAE